MPINIGDGNKIENSTIAEEINIKETEIKKTFAERHPVLISVIVSFVVGFILLFSFWEKVISFIEGVF